MQLSVIILNYNVRYFLELCVSSVQKAIEGLDAEIIVVDNNSTDESCQMMKERFPQVKLIENKENTGFPKGNNIGVAQAKGEYICILNPDTVVAEDTFLKILNSKLQTPNSKLGIIGCKLIDGTGKFLPESKRGVPTPWVAFTKIFGLYKIFPKWKVMNQYYAQQLAVNQSGKVAILVGAFMVMKRELYTDLGGFDENCFMYSDDIDLSYMALKKGKSNFYFHETTVIHFKGESTIRDGLYMKRFREAMQFFYKKHFNQSFIFDVMMKIGAAFFSVLKMFQGRTVSKTKPANFIFVTEKKENRALLKNFNVQEVFSTIDFSKNAERTEFIIDLNSVSYKKAIQLMEANKNTQYTFKFLLPHANFLIGSNSSNERGEVVFLE
ncbi:glycosyltransferase family 2 protein [Flavobacterium sp.]|uniref:glycosyltransferase family 2 protein n=1 Tax=Flavobacterium sp. TaxID=239 RepID=UPI00262B6481|nr:glycosyltransferase family 2 protein [Flavobacterium sp.]MDD2986327.1 glycosyltransferase family 2 protein [Flavobacterium sp.]